MTWKTAALLLAFLLAIIYIIYYKIQKMREAQDADVKRMNDLLAAVENHSTHESQNAGLPPNTVRAIEQASKIVVVCNFKAGKVMPDEEGGDCAVLLYGKADVYHALYTSRRLEYTVRFARRLSRILGLPIEMV